DGPRAGDLDEAAHDRGRLAALAGPVAGGVELFERHLVDVANLLEGGDLFRLNDDQLRLLSTWGLGVGRTGPPNPQPLFADADPGHVAVELVVADRALGQLVHLLTVGDRDVAAAEAADDVDDCRPLLQGIEGRADLVQQDPAVVGRAVGEVAVHHPD